MLVEALNPPAEATQPVAEQPVEPPPVEEHTQPPPPTQEPLPTQPPAGEPPPEDGGEPPERPTPEGGGTLLEVCGSVGLAGGMVILGSAFSFKRRRNKDENPA